MTPTNFVKALKSEVYDAAVTDVIAQIKKPSGRRPSESIQKLSKWFNQLTESDQQAVIDVASLSAQNAVFGFLCVLDGVRAIEDGDQESELQLNYIRVSEPIICLNPLSGSLLHDLFKSQF